MSEGPDDPGTFTFCGNYLEHMFTQILAFLRTWSTGSARHLSNSASSFTLLASDTMTQFVISIRCSVMRILTELALL